MIITGRQNNNMKEYRNKQKMLATIYFIDLVND